MTAITDDLRLDSLPAPAVADARIRSSFATRLLICIGIFTAVMGWTLLFPYSGYEDSVLHYLNAREVPGHWVRALFAWTRPGYKIPLSLFAAHGIYAAHFFNAVITAAAAWNTMKLAAELRLPHALMAGPLLILQPYVFALGADTMTELPLALGIVLAVRWWLAGRLIPACLLISYLPTVRPEGFFFGLIFGILVLRRFINHRRQIDPAPLMDDVQYTAGLMVCLSVGLIGWVIMCRVLHGDWLLVLHDWSWPVNSYSNFDRGTPFHYIICWPIYCGIPLFVLFVFGFIPAFHRSMRLPLILWTTVIGVHSILYWRGWFASCGLLRIMACTSPFTAIICLLGWNWFADRLRLNLRRPMAAAFCTIAAVYTLAAYCMTREHLHCIPLRRCTDYVQANHLLAGTTWYFTGDKISTAMLQGPDLAADQQMDMPCDADAIAKNLAALPIGTVGIWDNEQALFWHGHTIDELASHGFTILYETDTDMYPILSILQIRPPLRMRYVVLRKDGAYTYSNSR